MTCIVAVVRDGKAYLTAFVHLFAPVSYLLVAFLAVLFALAVFGAVLDVARKLGWRPRRREVRGPKRDAGLKAVTYYVMNESAWGLRTFGGDFEKVDIKAVEKEMMDRIGEGDLAVWGRIGHTQTSRIDGNWDSSSLSIGKGEVSVAGYMSVSNYHDIEFNWREIEKTWPKPPLWRRIFTRRLRRLAVSGKARAA